jgi:hypothetical protein
MARENAIIAVAELDRIAANGLRATGSSVGPGGVMDGDGYSNPAWGIGDVVGGLFVGIGRLFAACNVPNEIQPAVPPAGLFGPDAVIPWERFPGYTPPPDVNATVNTLSPILRITSTDVQYLT